MRSSLLAALALSATAAMEFASAAMPTPRKGSRDYDAEADRSLRPWGEKPQRNHALRQEIAAHNAAVDLRKAEKRARKEIEKRSNVRKAHL